LAAFTASSMSLTAPVLLFGMSSETLYFGSPPFVLRGSSTWA